MIRTRPKTTLALITLALSLAALLAAGPQNALAAPVKLILANHIGHEVNLTAVNAKAGPVLEDLCTIESGDECQPGRESTLPGGFNFPASTAASPNGNVYVADNGNSRVQELTPTGQFVLMFGKDVNATTGEDICTAASKDVCQAGVPAAAPGRLDSPLSIGVDPMTGHVYVAEIVYEHNIGGETSGQRVQEFTENGEFVLEIGKEVNATKKTNLCTAEEEAQVGVTCQGPRQTLVTVIPAGEEEDGSFNFAGSGTKNLVAIGGAKDLLYVADENRVQEFRAENGQWESEIKLGSTDHTRVQAMALDQETGNLYLVYGNEDALGKLERQTIHEFDASGEKIQDIEVGPRKAGRSIASVLGLALDATGHLAVAAREIGGPEGVSRFGVLDDASTGHRITEFIVPAGGTFFGLSFDGQGQLFAAAGSFGEEILVYNTEFVAELVTGSATCALGAELDTSVTLDCSLGGSVDPEGVAGTEAWFEWGRSEALGERTTKQSVAAAGPVSAGLQARPNETFYYQLAGEDLNVQAPEGLDGERLSFTTPAVAPRVVGEPSASFARSSSVVLSGELNPENAQTEIFFEYGSPAALKACPGVSSAACPGVSRTVGAESAVYGRIPTTLEATGLQPARTYGFRLAADNEHEAGGQQVGGQAYGAEGSFTTGAAPQPSAQTGAASAVMATSATVTGAVNPDGLPATYAFELGVYEGAQTQFGVVFSGSVGESSSPVQEALALAGLQPGTTYAYRIAVSSGYIAGESHTQVGAAGLFTTAGLAGVLAAPGELTQLAIPSVAFPPASKATTPKAAKKKKAKRKTTRAQARGKKCATGDSAGRGKCARRAGVRSRKASHKR